MTDYSTTAGKATLGFTLAANETGTATITITVTNSLNGTIATTTYNLTVNPITVTRAAISVATGNTEPSPQPS